MELRKSGKKRALICLLLLSASQRVLGGTPQWNDLFAPEFALWVADPLTVTTQIFYSAPPDADLHKFRPEPTLPRCASTTVTVEERDPSLSVNDFARLCAILYRDTLCVPR
jgi:hypothetical protein